MRSLLRPLGELQGSSGVIAAELSVSAPQDRPSTDQSRHWTCNLGSRSRGSISASARNASGRVSHSCGPSSRRFGPQTMAPEGDPNRQVANVGTSEPARRYRLPVVDATGAYLAGQQPDATQRGVPKKLSRPVGPRTKLMRPTGTTGPAGKRFEASSSTASTQDCGCRTVPLTSPRSSQYAIGLKRSHEI